MKFHAHIFFKSNPIDQPLDISNIVKIMVDQKEVLPDKLKIDNSETIILHCSGNTFGKSVTHSTMVLKSSELLAIEFVEDTND